MENGCQKLEAKDAHRARRECTAIRSRSKSSRRRCVGGKRRQYETNGDERKKEKKVRAVNHSGPAEQEHQHRQDPTPLSGTSDDDDEGDGAELGLVNRVEEDGDVGDGRGGDRVEVVAAILEVAEEGPTGVRL
jgi:hypothetical protein